ncbi:hypothetical protein MB90_001772 [Salmonella enterica subsp. enterica]|uniref:Uncharacterized protein n=3 Tax=Salmonella enterica TaxID=28901 RepID=A0A619AH16_SALET|nr:Cox family DNA-binding protein [Salmonella enterica]EAA3584901.1 hypothetical protein [Salmonella enterica subsp. enterica serovar Enteritidis]EBG0642722.1 hypothetical protein [Salmonella enterica subsp. enterica serovar Potsdam]EBW4857078.1 hypothetical protein [Salmonella enterica subsp. enterica serovar Havana]ECB3972415.1 hypothetical protein [Salmonella enterica subsp. enterica serovar Lexington]ECC3314880.1 hypothetical protein [Salmonella enterica subsp. enterica]ECH6832144.1 hypot
MEENTQNAAEITVEATAVAQGGSSTIEAVTDETTATEQAESNAATEQHKDAKKAEKPKRKSPEREEIRLAKNPAKLISKEGFALYIGKTVDAVVAMAKAAKAPAIYMADPLNPGGNAELYFDREEWDEACRQLVESAPPEWHDWRNRLFLFKPTSGRRKKKTDEQQAA